MIDMLWSLTPLLILLLAAVDECESAPHKNSPPRIPVVYFYTGHVPVHQWYTACVGLAHGNPVVVICDRSHPTCAKPDYLSGVQLAYIEDNIHPRYTHFKQVFKTFGGTGIVDLQRIFTLAQWMQSHKIETAFYGDSDAAVLTHVGMHRRRHCDAQLHLSLIDNNEMKMFWVAWIGSSIITLPFLQEFLEWAIALYADPKYHHLMLKKQAEAPNMCDMSVWYLFVCANAAANRYTAEATSNWNCPAELPRVNTSWLICDAQDDGFDSGRGMKKAHIDFLRQGTNNETGTPIMYAYHRSSIVKHRAVFRLSSLHTHAKDEIRNLFPFCSEAEQRKLMQTSRGA